MVFAMTKHHPKTEPEFHSDAWPRFERFIRDIAKAGPQHRKPIRPKKKNLRAAKRDNISN
jgi:hypothetical protein